jgi:hypothetical protein
MWRHCIAETYDPEELYRRFAWNVAHTYPNRIRPPVSPQRASWSKLRKAVRILANLLLRAGLVADYRGTFWRLAGPLLRQGRIEASPITSSPSRARQHWARRTRPSTPASSPAVAPRRRRDAHTHAGAWMTAFGTEETCKPCR